MKKGPGASTASYEVILYVQVRLFKARDKGKHK